MELLEDYEYIGVRLAIQPTHNRALTVYKTYPAVNMRTVGIVGVQDTENLAIFREIYGQRPIRGSEPAASTIQDRRDYGSNREKNEQRRIKGFKAKFRTLSHDLEGQIENMTLGNVKHQTN